MIERILLKNVASYSPSSFVSIGPLKRVNIFYGLNGSGKSTIGKYLQSLNAKCYSHCRIEGEEESDQVFVYNQDFIDKNFSQDTHPGIFTLNEGNIEAEAAIRAAQEKYEEKVIERKRIVDEGLALSERKTKETEVFKEALWGIKKAYDGGGLKYCLSGYNKDKVKFSERLIGHKLSQKIPRSMSDLLDAANQLLSTEEIPLPSLQGIYFSAEDIEGSPLFIESISASGDSPLSELIGVLGNSDWVKNSLQFIGRSDGKCPLCQQGLPHDFESNLKLLFDKTYDLKLATLSEMKEQYLDLARRCVDSLNSERFKESPLYSNLEFLELKEKIISVFDDNHKKIDEKINAPTRAVQIESVGSYVALVNALVDEGQKVVEAHNSRIKNKDKLLLEIANEFWDGLKLQAGPVIEAYDKSIKGLDAELEIKREEIRAVDKERLSLENSIVEFRSKITNIESSILNINRSMSLMGLAGFSIEKETGDATSYRLVRPEAAEGVFKSLSEGEKTLITFLYFLELTLGSVNSEEPTILSNRIVVIDDPVSSLSHNYVYEVSSLIYHKVIRPLGFKQILILTHNLFFFHELLKNAPRGEVKKYQCFRVVKTDFSDVALMDSDEVQNDYQGYWQVLKDARGGKVSPTVLPNIMRNILEHYFGFILKQDDLLGTLAKLEHEDAEFKPLFRYINRGSHADSINITDFGGIDSSRLISKFELIFERSGFPEHYRKMMGTEETES